MRLFLRGRATIPLLALLLLGCDRSGSLDDGTDEGPDPTDPWFELGHLGREHFPDGIAIEPLPFDRLDGGEPVEMILGGQGLVMFALPIRAGNFHIDLDTEEPDWPMLDTHVDVEGHNDGIGGHFARIANYPVWFDETSEGEYEFFFLTILIPDDDVLDELVGLPATIEATLEPHGKSPITVEVDFVVGTAPGA